MGGNLKRLKAGVMAREEIKSVVICDHAEYRNYICFEHTTYLFEFSKIFGPVWFTVPGKKWVDVEPGGTMSFLWDIFTDWYKNYEQPQEATRII